MKNPFTKPVSLIGKAILAHDVVAAHYKEPNYAMVLSAPATVCGHNKTPWLEIIQVYHDSAVMGVVVMTPDGRDAHFIDFAKLESGRGTL